MKNKCLELRRTEAADPLDSESRKRKKEKKKQLKSIFKTQLLKFKIMCRENQLENEVEFPQ